MSPSTALFTLGLISLGLAANTVRPSMWWPIRGLSFVTQVFASETAVWLGALVVLGSAALIRAGALAAPLGIAGAALSAGAALLFWRQLWLALHARPAVAQALKEGGFELPAEAPERWRRALLPRFLNASGVERIGNLRYAEGAGSRRLLDIYRPRGGVTGAPVLLQIHGGAWVVGSKRTQGRPLLVRMAASGFVCVAVNYRLGFQHKFPAALVDCKLALKWIREHIAEYGGDPSRVVVSGGSAGGHLAAMLALTANNPVYQRGFESIDTSVLACAPVYAPFDLPRVIGYSSPRLAAWFSQKVFASDLVQSSPVTHVRPGAPPMFVIQGGADNIVPPVHAHEFVAAMRAAGNSNLLSLELPGTAHAFDIFHSVRSEATVEGLRAFFLATTARR